MNLDQIIFSTKLRANVDKMLHGCKIVANSVGLLADKDRQFQPSKENINKFIGTVQIGEYLHTGQIPESELVRSIIKAN